MKQLLLIMCLAFLSTGASATHNIGGFITYTKDTSPTPNARKFHFKLTLITDRSSQADDPNVQIDMGDGVVLTVNRASVKSINPYIDQEEFNWDYTFGSDGTFTASWTGINRNPGILNITQPSDMLTAYISTTVNVNSTRHPNSGPQFLAPEAINASVGKQLNFNLLAYDPDGDSLSYRLYTPLYKTYEGAVNPVPGYTFPDETFACNSTTNSGNATFRISQRDGQLTWDAPCRVGEYTIMVMVEEWDARTRKIKLSRTMYDMNIRVTGETASEITLANKDELKITPSGHIEARATQPLELKINYAQLEQAVAPIPETPDQQTITAYFASELSQVLKIPVSYTLEETATGVVGTFRFTPTKELIRTRPYFVSFYGIKSPNNPTPTTASFGIVIRDNEPKLRLVETRELIYSAAKHILIASEEISTIKVLAEDFPDHEVTLTAESLLAEGSTKFTFDTEQGTEGTIGELSIQPDKSQISGDPKTITFKAIYNPALPTGGGVPIFKELQVQVIVVPKALASYLGKKRSKRHFLFPNKVSDRFTVGTETQALLSIYSLQGKLIIQQQLQPGETEIQKPNTIPGLYFYTLTTPDGQKETGKLLLQ